MMFGNVCSCISCVFRGFGEIEFVEIIVVVVLGEGKERVVGGWGVMFVRGGMMRVGGLWGGRFGNFGWRDEFCRGD